MAMESSSNPKPSQIPTTTTKKPRPKTKEVSSRYLSTPSSSTISRCPPMTTSPVFHHTNNSSSTTTTTTTVPRPDRYPDENALSETLPRRKMRLFSDNAAQTPHRSTDRRLDALGLFRENPLRANDDVGLSAAATRSVDWGRDRKEGLETPSLCRTSMRSDGQRHSFESNKDGGGGRTFPPLKGAAAQKPPNGKPGAEARKERKGGLRREEEVHSARMLECRYLQWRFANARARAVDCARTKAAEKTVYNVSCKLQELRDSVMAKRMELEQLKRLKSLHTIIEAQMPYLDDWTCIEGEYSSSLSGATEALQNASSQIPITGSVKAHIGELKDVMDSAVNMLDVVSPCVDKFLTKAEDIEILTSELAKVVAVEKSMIEECGNLLAVAHDFQVKECSLRSQLIQAKQQQSSGK